MSAPDPRRNDDLAWVEDAASHLLRASHELVAAGEQARISDTAIAALLTAAARLYAAKTDGEERTFPALLDEGAQSITPTELLTAISEMLRAARLGPMELALWYRRRPEPQESR